MKISKILGFVLISCCIILILYKFSNNIGIYINDNEYTDKEKFILKKIGKHIDNFNLVTNDFCDEAETYVFTFNDGNKKNIGLAVFYHENLNNKCYCEESFVDINYNPIKNTKPFELYSLTFSTPSNLIANKNSVDEFTSYYGNINDSNIKTIAFDFISESYQVLPVDNVYSVLIKNTLVPNNIKGLDYRFNTIYDFFEDKN